MVTWLSSRDHAHPGDDRQDAPGPRRGDPNGRGDHGLGIGDRHRD
ncbi:hypothetical protein QJS66_08480 [Kocuria rhizophila]|nr:hypothetical protein QJS66_08480 [Kocuria rhizophila]